MSEIRKKVDQVIKLGITAYMKENGFKKTGRDWRKETPDGWHLMNIQASAYNKGQLGKIAVNLGIYNTEIEDIALQFHYKEKNTLPKATGATLECRLNRLAYDQLGHWWVIDSGTDLQETANEVVSKMTSHGMPWLIENDNVSDISDLLRDSAGNKAAIVAALISGDTEEATRRFRQALECRPHGAESLKKWAMAQKLDLV